MIGQYLSNTNERATVSVLQNILELNKALLKTFGERLERPFQNWLDHQKTERMKLILHSRISVLLHCFPQSE